MPIGGLRSLRGNDHAEAKFLDRFFHFFQKARFVEGNFGKQNDMGCFGFRQGRVNVMFVIQRDGSIGGIRMRGPDKNLEAEALRIINLLPNMTPGRQRGRPVKVPFSIPITFRLQ